ncbi:hypothetical protein CDAR_175221 [Caerostris darwini]|uniref:Uncharacterized protein n=1 Tax=Caerostris darwini TaxID=1538125 RepID=A0AAV4VZY8_9ARAC|nr:hypothetical protein CDAR_175221 [Caerostris darwini]
MIHDSTTPAASALLYSCAHQRTGNVRLPACKDSMSSEKKTSHSSASTECVAWLLAEPPAHEGCFFYLYWLATARDLFGTRVVLVEYVIAEWKLIHTGSGFLVFSEISPEEKS